MTTIKKKCWVTIYPPRLRTEPMVSYSKPTEYEIEMAKEYDFKLVPATLTYSLPTPKHKRR